MWTGRRTEGEYKVASKYDHRGLPSGQGFYWKRRTIYCKAKGKLFSCGTDKVAEALSFKESKLAELKQAQAEGVKSVGTVQELFTDYVKHLEDREAAAGDYIKTGRTTSNRTEGVIRNHLAPFFGTMKPENVRYQTNAYKDARRAAGAKATSYNGEFRILSAALNLAAANLKVSKNLLPVKYPFDHKS